MISRKENDPGSWEGQTASGRFLKSSLKSEQKEVGVEVEIEIRMKVGINEDQDEDFHHIGVVAEVW